jgi:hypothetical protein
VCACCVQLSSDQTWASDESHDESTSPGEPRVPLPRMGHHMGQRISSHAINHAMAHSADLDATDEMSDEMHSWTPSADETRAAAFADDLGPTLASLQPDVLRRRVHDDVVRRWRSPTVPSAAHVACANHAAQHAAGEATVLGEESAARAGAAEVHSTPSPAGEAEGGRQQQQPMWPTGETESVSEPEPAWGRGGTPALIRAELLLEHEELEGGNGGVPVVEISP